MDKNITNISYTNKDFGAIYSELLNLTKQLTNKWDPSLSNESDPGVVLLKLAAFIGDKNNYNIDMNVLENFLPTASQEKSVRNIVEMNGYTPKYYVSATGDLAYIFTDTSEEFTALLPFTIPAFSLTVTSEDGSITYTQAEALTVEEANKQTSCKFIEGTLQEFTINDSNVITMDNIDSNYRLYFSNKYIAQNGIYFYNQSGELQDWKKSDYIFTEPLGTKVYTLDYDSELGIPYIQFPEDIASLIGGGLIIKYIQTSGLNGNVSAAQLNTPSSSLSIEDATISTDNITVSNLSAITNGKDPETLSEMYNSFKKTVGTFETLVTCKDYSNAIYNLKTSEGENLVSNVVVTDRRNDYNKSLNVACYDAYGSYFEALSIGNSNTKFNFIAPDSNANKKYDLRYNTNSQKYEYWTGASWIELNSISMNLFTQMTEQITPYDLNIYAFKTLLISDYSYYKFYQALENSFKPASKYTLEEAKNDIEDIKCINHVYKAPSNEDVFCFKNYAPVNATITTYNKISKVEKVEILNNIYKALTQAFNAHNIEFGEELSYDDVEDCILNADSRIKKISLSDFVYTPKYMLADGSEGLLYNSEIFVDLVAKNVLAGRLCLFDFNSNFEHSYGMVDTHEISNIVSISTKTEIDLQPNVEYTLKNNEVINIVYPKYVSTASYGSYIKYKTNLNNEIVSGSTYILGSGESLDVSWTSDGIANSESYGAGTIIKSTVNLQPGEIEGTLASDQSIEIQMLAKTMYAETMLPCYWITNNSGNILFETDENGKASKILDEDEYFVVTNSDYSTFMMYGAGTIINLSSTLINKQISTDKISVAELLASGLGANFTWYKLNLFNGDLTILESNIIGLIEGDTVALSLDNIITVDNTWKSLTDVATKVTYKLSSEESSTEQTISGDNWWIRSRLDLDMTNSEPMTLSAGLSGDSVQTIDITYENELGIRQTSTITGSTDNGTICLLSSTDISEVGGENLDFSLYSQLGYDLKMLYYNKLSNPYEDSRNIVFSKVAEGAEEATEYYKRADGNFTTVDVGGDKYYKHLIPVLSNVITVGDTQKSDSEYDPSIYKALFGYQGLLSTVSTNDDAYILPVFLSYEKESNIKAYFEVVGDVKTDDGTILNNVSFLIKHYGDSTASTSTMLRSNENNLLTPAIKTNFIGEEIESKIIIATLKLCLEVTNTPTDVETISLENIQIIDGVNSSVSSLVTLSQVINRIQELIQNSDKPDTKFNYINKPNKSFEIDVTDWSDPSIMFDKNNVANHITISQLDLRNSKVDFVKAVQDYD
jgi:hypothetical protein